MDEPLFVYGTLRPDRAPRAIAAHVGALRRLGPARVRGRLYDLRCYPGAVLAVDADGWIEGELVALAPGAPPLAWFDEYEGYDPRAPETSLFRRTRAQAIDASGAVVPCWTYEYARAVEEHRRIASGEWRGPAGPGRAAQRRVIGFAHRGRRADGL